MHRGKHQKASENSDEMLVKRCQEGDRETFVQLFERHQAGIFSFVLRMVKNQEETEDIVQEIFLNVYGALPRFKSGSLFKPWLYKIASNACISALRKAKKSELNLSFYDEIQVETIADAKPLAINYCEMSETRQIIQNAISALPEGYRLAILLRYEEGLSYKEIASALNISISSVSTRLYEARKLIQRKINDKEKLPF